jgi:class 3 adenylate cyclase/ActR/RegA family two-component response regulator
MEILSVDDDALNQQVIQELMASDGFRVTRAMSGDQALEILERRFLTQGGVEHFPDIILMDLMMPGSTGREATQKIRELYPSSNIPIIMVSAIDDEVEICAGLRAGCNDYVTKPFRHLELRARVQLQLRIVDYYRQSLAAKQDERILMEILPRSVLDRLKSGQSMIADELSDVSVVFSDIVGFTEMTARHSTLEIISMLDELFTKFDALVELHCSYKVETIGDAYMIACGLNSQEGHALTAINLAVDMVSAAASMRVPSGAPLRIRVGIHSGTAYAGVVGQKCPRYCLFGDTVNTASRMESHGFPMTVHISDATFQRACMEEFNTYGFHDLGQRAIKGKGHMQTWLVEEGEWIAAVHDFEKNLCSRSRSSRALLNYYRVSFDSESAAGTPSRSSNGESVHDSLSSLEADGLELDVRSPAPLLASTSPVTNDFDDDGEEGASKS